MHPRSVIAGNAFVAGTGHLEHAAVVFDPVLFRKLRLIGGNRLFQRRDRGVLLRHIRLVFLQRRFLIVDVSLKSLYLLLFFPDQRIDRLLLLFQACLRGRKHLFFLFQRLLAKLHIFHALTVFLQLLAVVSAQLFHIFCLIEHIRKAFRAYQKLQIAAALTVLIQKAEPLFHIRILLVRDLLRLFKVSLRLRDFFFFLGDLLLQLVNLCPDVRQLAVQLLYIGFQIAFGFFQILYHRFDIGNAGLELFLFLLRLTDRFLFLLDAVLKRARLHAARRDCRQKQRSDQTACKTLPYPFPHSVPSHQTRRCLRTVAKLPKNPMPAPSPIHTGTSVRYTSETGRNCISPDSAGNCSATYSITCIYRR